MARSSLVDIANEEGPVSEVFRRVALVAGAQLALAADHQSDLGRRAQRSYQDVETFEVVRAVEAREEERQAGVGGQPELGARSLAVAGAESLRVDACRQDGDLVVERRHPRPEEVGRLGVVDRSHQNLVGGAQDAWEQQAPMPAEYRPFPAVADDVHLVLHDQRRTSAQPLRGEQLGGAEERIVDVNQVEAAGTAENLRQAGGIAEARQRSQLDDLDPRWRRAGAVGVARCDHGHVDALADQRGCLVVCHRSHAAAVRRENGGDVRDSHPLTSPMWSFAVAQVARRRVSGRCPLNFAGGWG